MEWECLRNINMPLKGEALPILGIATLALGYAIRSMISTSLACSTYIEDISDINNTFTETTKNTVINIIIAMQIATIVAVTTAVVVAGDSSS